MAKRKNKEVQTINLSQLDTYFKQRMFAIGITDTSAHCFRVEGDFPSPSYNVPIFAETPAGDIEINYPSLYGGAEVIAGTETPFTRIRFKPENMPDRERKYFQEKNSGIHIFLPPAIIDKYSRKEKIKTLYLTEGEFKAFSGALYGIDIIGLGGKDLFTDGEKKLHGDVLAIIRACDVENLVLLLDADVNQVTWDVENEPEKDLAKRLYSFYNTVIRFREMAKGEVKDAYFSHIRSEFLKENAKGLDDLLFSRKGKEGEPEKIVEDLYKLSAARAYFSCINLGTHSPDKIKGLFCLKTIKGIPSAFYYKYEDVIKEHEFNFCGARYKKTKNGEGLELVKHEDSFKFMRVGCDYVKIIHVPDAKGILRRRLKGWKSGEINRDYINLGYKNFYETLEKYDEYCNVPCNTADYQSVIQGCYNMYYQITHEPEAGSWTNIEKYLKHAFGEAKILSGHTNYDLILDYLQLLYLQPTQILPIVCLVSEERNTGKSTFLWLLKEIFQDNATFIGSEDLKDQFNDDWASKLVINIDEGFIDKKFVLEKVKSLSVAFIIKLRMMHQGRTEIPFFGKFVINSNDETNFIGIDEKEVRFWVNKVPVIKELDPDLLTKMRDEIPAFLHYLSRRTLLHPKKTRAWFDFDLIETEAGKKVKENNKGWLYSDLTTTLKEKFALYRYPTLFYTLTEIAKMLNGEDGGVKYRKFDIEKQLKDKFHINPVMRRYEFPIVPGDHSAAGATTKSGPGRVYEFRIENFFTEQELRTDLAEYFDYDKIILSRPGSAAPANDDLPF